MFGKWKRRALSAEAAYQHLREQIAQMGKRTRKLKTAAMFRCLDISYWQGQWRRRSAKAASLAATGRRLSCELALLRADYGRLEELKSITSKALDEWKALEGEAQAKLTLVREQRNRARDTVDVITEAVADLNLTVELHGVPIIAEKNADTAAKTGEPTEDDDWLSPYEEFAVEVQAAGLTPRHYGIEGHWLIEGGQTLVHVYPETSEEFRMQADGEKETGGNIEQAIEMARRKTVTV